jgi:hypothetical protein
MLIGDAGIIDGRGSGACSLTGFGVLQRQIVLTASERVNESRLTERKYSYNI